MNGQFVAAVLSLAGCFLLLCRVDKMLKGVTKPVVFIQHSVLALGLFVSFMLNINGEEAWSAAAVAAGVLGFFLLSLHRWRHAAPEGTTKPAELGPPEWRHVSGGERET